ncbi:hypothetical protein [Vampirovibrio sp.]|uniref:hypothetical protein n=1 Tax=Vampirovibrio sp. TaxID=2717857 RepID=UPI003592F0E1
MKLPMKVAGLCWSITFLVTSVPGFYQQTRPMDFAAITTESFSGMAIVETLAVSLLGSFAAAIIGFMIGDILSNPHGTPNDNKKEGASSGLPATDGNGNMGSPAELALGKKLDDLYPEDPPEPELEGEPPTPDTSS